MEALQRISKTDLARKTRQVLRNVQRGQTTIVESHGQAEAAILDIVDYRILRAAVLGAAAAPAAAPDAVNGLDAQAVAALADEQERYNLVIGMYLSGAISLARAAELLELPAIDLRFRFVRLGLPVRLGVEIREEIQEDIDTAASWGK
jgi:hypothetical protein